jgi:hypothetical protein
MNICSLSRPLGPTKVITVREISPYGHAPTNYLPMNSFVGFIWIIWPWGQRSRSHECHYGTRHTGLWSCTHIPNIIDLSRKTKMLWSGQENTILKTIIWPCEVTNCTSQYCFYWNRRCTWLACIFPNYVSPSNEGRHIVLVWFFLPLLLPLLLSEACPDHNFFVFPDRSIIFGMWVHDHKRSD